MMKCIKVYNTQQHSTQTIPGNPALVQETSKWLPIQACLCWCFVHLTLTVIHMSISCVPSLTLFQCSLQVDMRTQSYTSVSSCLSLEWVLWSFLGDSHLSTSLAIRGKIDTSSLWWWYAAEVKESTLRLCSHLAMNSRFVEELCSFRDIPFPTPGWWNLGLAYHDLGLENKYMFDLLYTRFKRCHLSTLAGGRWFGVVLYCWTFLGIEYQIALFERKEGNNVGIFAFIHLSWSFVFAFRRLISPYLDECGYFDFWTCFRATSSNTICILYQILGCEAKFWVYRKPVSFAFSLFTLIFLKTNTFATLFHSTIISIIQLKFVVWLAWILNRIERTSRGQQINLRRGLP